MDIKLPQLFCHAYFLGREGIGPKGDQLEVHEALGGPHGMARKAPLPWVVPTLSLLLSPCFHIHVTVLT
jgi:hypothetical protein